MLTDKDIDHIASLARIKINEKEKDKLKKDMSSILGYIDKLNKIKTENIEPISQTTGITNAFRADKNRKEFKMDEELNEKLIGQAPHKKERFIKVKSILKK